MRRIALVAAGMVLGGNAFADNHGEGKAKFTMQQSALTWGKLGITPDGGDEVSTTTLTTRTDDLYVQASWNGMSVYLYPHGTDQFSVSYMVMPELEVGLDLGMHSESKSEGDEATDDMKWGLWGTYYVSLGKPTVEVTVAVANDASKDTDAANVETKSATMTYGFQAQYVLPLAGGFSYVAGLSYAMGSESESKTDLTNLGVKLAAFRLEW